jgi:hypothetical protein
MTMKKPTAKQLREQQALEAELEKARDEGRGWFVNHTDALLLDVGREGSRMYDCDGLGKHFVLAFVEGFTQARDRREEWLREREEP